MEVGDGVRYAGKSWGEGDLQSELHPLLPGGGAGGGSDHTDAVSLPPYFRAVMILRLMLGATGKRLRECFWLICILKWSSQA